MKKVLETKTKTRFQDCDPFNHLNNSKYLDYFINAREDQVLENYGIDIFGMIRTELKGWVVMSNQIAYFKPAFTMETVVIESQVIGFSDKSLKVEMRMYNQEKTELKSLLWANFVHFDVKLQKPTSHSEPLMLLFNEVVFPVDESNFEVRMEAIKRMV
jgi:thioesterase III